MNLIAKQGFRAAKELPSVSFYQKSFFPLKYACEARSENSPNGVIIAVKFNSLNNKGIRIENDFIYINPEVYQPELIAFCIIPADYFFI